MSDEKPTLPERAARSAFFTIIGHGAASLSLVAILWLGTTVTALDKQFTALRAEMTVGVVPRIASNERDIELIQAEMNDRTRDRFTATDAAALELRLLREIADLQAELRRLIEKWEKLQ